VPCKWVSIASMWSPLRAGAACKQVGCQLGVKAPISCESIQWDAMTHPYISTGLKENKFRYRYRPQAPAVCYRRARRCRTFRSVAWGLPYRARRRGPTHHAAEFDASCVCWHCIARDGRRGHPYPPQSIWVAAWASLRDEVPPPPRPILGQGQGASGQPVI